MRILKTATAQRTSSRFAARSRARKPRRDRLAAESLEIRSLLSASAWPELFNAQVEAESNDTLDAAQDLGRVGNGLTAEVVGCLGDGTNRTSDVDWFRWTLESAGRVQLTALPDAGGVNSAVVLTLYGDQFSEFDPDQPLQHPLLGRREASANGSVAQLDQRLAAGTYFVAVSGAGNRHFHPFVADSGVPSDAAEYGLRIAVQVGRAPSGPQDQFAPLSEPLTNGDDTPETATSLGDLTSITRLQVSGVIGDDRFYDTASDDPQRMNPASDVDLYHFTITGDGSFALVAEALAGRIGSPLDPALTLYRADASGTLHFVGANNNTLNATESTNGQLPFFSDSVLFAGLSAGDYFLAVSSSGNDSEFGTDGVFDPQVAHSGSNGGTVGKYVLDLLVYADSTAPQVLVTTPADGSTVSQSPRFLELQFSEQVNVRQLAETAFQQVGQNTVRAVFIIGADGERYFPRLQSFDSATATARFLMLDGLPNGVSELHLSGSLGLTDGAGLPLAGNDASGDFVTRFTVADVTRVGIPTQRLNVSNNDSFATAQDLGALFPHELQAGVTLIRNAATNSGEPSDTSDYFRFELLQTQSYFFSRTNNGSGDAPVLEILDADGNVVPLAAQPGDGGLLGFLRAGTYVLHVGSWTAESASDVRYQIEIELGGASENPTPLTNGAAPAVGIRLVGNGPDAASVTPLPVVVVRTVAAPEFAAIPTGLNSGLNAALLGSSNSSPTTFGNDAALVRLFGFSDRDRLFALLDSSPRTVTRATEFSLSESDWLDLWASAESPRKESSDSGKAGTTTNDAAADADTTPSEDAGEATSMSETSEQPQAESETPRDRETIETPARKSAATPAIDPRSEVPLELRERNDWLDPVSLAAVLVLKSAESSPRDRNLARRWLRGRRNAGPTVPTK